MGKVYKQYEHKPKLGKNFKKVFVLTSHKFDPFLNTSDSS
jgi:hypothetical protein